MIRWLSVVVLVACSSQQPPVVSAQSTPLEKTLERAQAFERGVNGPREYREAARLYEQACDGGKGDIAACHRWIDAALHTRGADAKLGSSSMSIIVKALCERRDSLGCVLGGLSGDEASKEAFRKLPDPEQDCGPGNAAACETALAIQFPNFQGSTGAAARQDDLEDRACRAGVLAGCLGLIEAVRSCTYVPGASRCVDKLLREWKKYESEDHLHALAEATTACDRGDAKACDILPGRRIDARVLCDAHDWGACGELGCLGDTAMTKLAESHGAWVNCQAIQNRANAASRPEPPPRPGLPADPSLPAFTPSSRPLFDTLAFWRHATEPEESSWPEFDIHNLGTREIIVLQTTAYAYDKTGALVAKTEERRIDVLALEPGKSFTNSYYGARVLPAEAVAFSICYDAIGFAPLVFWQDAIPCRATPAMTATVPRAIDGAGSSVQRWFHAAAAQAFTGLRLHYGFVTTFGSAALSSSQMGLAELAAGSVAFAGTETAPAPDAVGIPILVGSLAVLYNLSGVDKLQLSPATLARIYQHDITTWNDRAIAADNPGVKLPARPIVAYHDAHDSDETQQLASYLERAARGVWRLKSGAALTWPAGARSAVGILSEDGAISYANFADLIHERSIGLRYSGKVARIRNRSGKYVEPTAESTAAAARELTGKLAPGALDARNPAAYPISFPSWMVVARPSDRGSGVALATYLAYLLGDGQRLLPALGLAPLPPGVAAAARAQAAQLAP